MTAPDRAEKMLARMTDHVAAITGLYVELTPEQKKIFDDFHSALHAGKHGKHGKTEHHADGADKKTQMNTAKTSKPAKEKSTATPMNLKTSVQATEFTENTENVHIGDMVRKPLDVKRPASLQALIYMG